MSSALASGKVNSLQVLAKLAASQVDHMLHSGNFFKRLIASKLHISALGVAGATAWVNDRYGPESIRDKVDGFPACLQAFDKLLNTL